MDQISAAEIRAGVRRAFSLIELFRAAGLYFRTRYKNPVQTIGILAALPVLLFSFFFIPENINFRILYIPGFLLFVLPSIERRYSPDNFHPGKAWPVAVAAIALFLVNLTPSFLPASNPSSNPRLTEVGQLMEYVTPGDMIIYPWTDDGHTLSLYAQYFLGCDALTINKLIDLENAGGDQIISGLFGDSSDGRIIFVDAALVNVAGGSGSIASRYECELTQAEIDEFIDRWLVPADDEIPTINRHYIVYTPR